MKPKKEIIVKEFKDKALISFADYEKGEMWGKIIPKKKKYYKKKRR